ncbi:MAG: GNAT family N-acetyltransferase [Sedimenticola sp.]|nr:GNAT family N-acetyltransferase [Sedimenticola sp.]
MTCSITIETAQTGHLADLAILCDALGYPAPAPQLATRLARLNRHPDHRLYLALSPERTVGWIHLVYTLRLTSAPYVEIAGLVVDSAYRSRGVGRQLIARAHLWAAQRQATQLRVRCQSDRQQAHRFYRANGFCEIKQQQVFSLPLTS